MYSTLKPILINDFGVSINSEYFLSMTSYQIKNLLIRKGFLLIKDLNFKEILDFIDFVKLFGEPVQYYDKNQNTAISEYKDLVQVDGDTNRFGEPKGKLPLHADGALSQTYDELLFLYARKIENMNFQGATTICNHELAYSELPIHLKKILTEKIFEVKVYDTGQYTKACEDDWFEIPVIVDYGWGTRMFLYFPFLSNTKMDWETRIKGFSISETKDFFDELEKFFTQPKYLYKHLWEKGDLLLIDNRRALHSREKFYDGTRMLYRGSVNEY